MAFYFDHSRCLEIVNECNITFTISFSAQILTISSVFALFLLLLFLLFPFLPVDFDLRFKVDPRIDAPHFDRLIHLIHLSSLTKCWY